VRLINQLRQLRRNPKLNGQLEADTSMNLKSVMTCGKYDVAQVLLIGVEQSRPLIANICCRFQQVPTLTKTSMTLRNHYRTHWA
jgi:hypothetical protein